MPEPDDVELPPSYEFPGGLAGFDDLTPAPAPDPGTPDPGAPGPGAPGPGAPGPGASGTPTTPAVPAPRSPAPAPAQPAPRLSRRAKRALYGTPPPAPTVPGGTNVGGTGVGGTSRASGTPSPSASITQPPGTARTPRKRRVGAWWIGAVAAGVVGFSVYSANGDNGFFNPSEAEKPIEVLPDAAQRAWSIDLPYNEPRLVPLPVNGTSTRGVPSAEMIIVGDFVIGRLTENVYEEGQETIIEAFAVADGSRTPLATMIDPVCATNSSGLEGEEATASSSAETTAPSPDLLVCAGGLEDRPQILVLDPAAGGAVGGWDVPRDVAMIGSSPQGVVTIDKPKDGETTVRWYEPDGTAVWTQDLASLGADIDTFINDEDKFGYRVNLSPVGDGFVFSSVEAVVAVNRAGVSYAAPCWSLVVTGDVYACVDFESGELVARAIDGTQRWSGPEVTIVQGVYQRAPILVSEEYVYDDKYTVESMDYAVIDAVTGVQGPTLVEILDRGRADLMGTPEHPMLIEIERQDDYDDPTTITVHALAPDGSQVLWSTEIQGLQYARSVLVGERVLIEVEYGSWTVIDVATGEITGGVEIVGAPATEVDGDVIASNYGGIERIALP